MLGDALDRKAARQDSAGISWTKGRPDADAPLTGDVLAMVVISPVFEINPSGGLNGDVLDVETM
ncbi:hypothetical protein [Sphingobium sp. 15-1]|uniref:hypothetical protein n=1 Tax=Sphingobium TaxID=165695 RepID=UPI00350F7788